MVNNSKETWNAILKVILYIFFISAFITIIVFITGQGWFNVLIDKLNWSYETLEIVRNILVKVFIVSAITSFISSIISVAILLFRT